MQISIVIFQASVIIRDVYTVFFQYLISQEYRFFFFQHYISYKLANFTPILLFREQKT